MRRVLLPSAPVTPLMRAPLPHVIPTYSLITPALTSLPQPKCWSCHLASPPTTDSVIARPGLWSSEASLINTTTPTLPGWLENVSGTDLWVE